MKRILLFTFFALGCSAAASAQTTQPGGGVGGNPCDTATQSCGVPVNPCTPVLGPGDAFAFAVPGATIAIYYGDEAAVTAYYFIVAGIKSFLGL